MYKNQSYKYFLNLISIFILLILLDQSTKIYVAKIMINNNFQNIEIFPFLNITFVRNTGISFGLFSDGGIFNRYFFTALAMIIGTTLLIIALFNPEKLIQISLLFISGGAIGNAIDRVYFGGVIDFIDFFIYNIHWPAFNFADIFITVGVFFLLFENFFGKIKNV
ncbi:MAG: signal peptidase II [Pseudomonadota bacterium]|nr:signal peptidase II [Pseudomonadota bacterium]